MSETKKTGKLILTRKDFVLVFVSFLIWVGLVELRPHILKARCGVTSGAPSLCSSSDVPFFDQPGLGLESPAADGYSYNTQNMSGILALTLPVVWNAGLILSGTLSPAAALAQSGVHFVLFLETWGINGAITEATRVIVQRPRPFVYNNPEQAKDPQNYVSFYSGHTSFSAAATTYLLLILLCYGVPNGVWLGAVGLSQSLVISTAVFRILSGRHFLSDVVMGAFAGTCVALAVVRLHMRDEAENGPSG